MTYPFRRNLIAAVTALALPGAVLAQQAQQQQGQQQGQKQQAQAQKNLSQIRASELKSMEVVDAQGKEIGEIAEVVVDLQSGRVHAAVLEFGGVMGVGEKQYAFSPKELQPGKAGNQLVLNIEKQKLENREGFAKNQWPAMGDDYWGRVGSRASAGASQKQPQGQTQSQGGQKQSQGAQQNLMRVSEIIGKDVQDKQGQDVGEVRDVVLDLRSGQIRNIVLEVQEGGRATVQPKSLSLGTGDKLITSMNRDQLKNQARKSGGGRAQQRDAGDSASAGSGNRTRGDGNVGVFGPERAGKDPFGAAKSGTVQGGRTTQGERIGSESNKQ